MQSTATSVAEYLDSLPEDRRAAMQELYNIIRKNIPGGFADSMQYGMISFVVPHSSFPAGYHCKPTDALPFLSIASQKNFIALYHMGIYTDPRLLAWFIESYSEAGLGTPDMGKSCIRFKKPDKIPFALIGELSSKISVQDWITTYQESIKK